MTDDSSKYMCYSDKGYQDIQSREGKAERVIE